MMDRCRCCVLVAGCAIIVLAVVVGEPVDFKYQFINDCKTAQEESTCEDVWSAFEQAYVGKDPSKVLPEAYDDLLSVAPPLPKCNQMLFWSGTSEVAHQVAKGCYQTLEDTLLGSVLDGKKEWCGKMGSKDTFTSSCASGLENNPYKSFWSRVSTEFAAVACGKVVVLLNGDELNPFYPQSYFALFEVGNFKHGGAKEVESLTVVLVTKNEVGDKCDNTSLMDLKKKLKPGINYICKTVTKSKLIKWTKERGKSCKPCW
ncbi:ADP-ribosyl cyclase/cyclic ADP-ribose hydrolase 1 [Gadus morhua]|uniref:ADP-ribosyl cyclase/cyclic ADP-ribose hydrolase 1 n=1 Tax=Gadus morhua TaxID=8049 RepID=UPI0011B6FFA0|nr:ADP-ribosyl cyclase/cyclic ADP-ribose hydrolase 1-like [Gadus morhua]